MSTITKRVELGASLLDRKLPGWHRLIDVERLDIGSHCGCVAGQLGALHDPQAFYSRYTAGLEMLCVDQQTAIALGFDHAVSEDDPYRLVSDEYEELTVAWRELITARLAADRAEGTS